MQKPPTLALIILDGWGYSETTQHNAIAAANTPFWHKLWQNYPHTLLTASEESVGLPKGQMGNSEVGHLTLGAGRILDQDLNRISKAIQANKFCEIPIWQETLTKLKDSGKTLHILGLLSEGGVHSHLDHFLAAIQCAADAGVKHIAIHAFLDGRDSPPKSAEKYIQKLEDYLKAQKIQQASIVSLCGRFYAMDRDKRFERSQLAYELISNNQAEYSATTALAGLKLAYERGETDEFVKPTLIGQPLPLQDQDAILFMNFRADRARQLTAAFLKPDFQGFERKSQPKLSAFLSLTEYAKDLKTGIIFQTPDIKNNLGEILEAQHLKQLRIAETEKYAHVTFFFNGGREAPYHGEERILIPSPKVKTYDLKPAMSAKLITERLQSVILERTFDVIILNFANADMLGHTGNFEAAQQSIEVLDGCLEKLVTTLQTIGGEALITADHGNVECMFDEKIGQAHTAHTLAKVPFIYVGRKAVICKENGNLADVAPTLLYLLGYPKAPEMTGDSLIQLT